jgi:aldehyde dehydrogenase (NAD+)
MIVKHIIDNKPYVFLEEHFDKLNPSTEQVIASVPLGKKLTVNLAVASSRKAFSSWKLISRVKRAEYLKKVAELIGHYKEDIATDISLETGKSLNESRAEVVEAIHMVEYTVGKGREPYGSVIASELDERDCYMIRKPKGVVGIISPWNFPFAIPYWNSAPAILEGNTVVLKPSEETPLSANWISKIYTEAGLPDGVFNLIYGDGVTGELLVLDDVNHICFTGSAETGMSIRKNCANSFVKSCSCEMGSKSATVVFADGDQDLALTAAVNSAFKLSGQRCVSSGRILVERSVFPEFSSKFVERVKKLSVGDPMKGDFNFGPLINQKQLYRVEKYNSLSMRNYDNLLIKGSRLDQQGYFLTPHVYVADWADLPHLKEEVFGPHVALIPFNGLDEAIHIYNDTPYGLALGVITNDFRKMREIKLRCDAGMIYFNLGSVGAESHLGFGGIGKSGYGGGSAAATFETVTDKVSITVNHGLEMKMPQGLK